ncbi:aldehyde dehydrogenase family protein [Amycolatopsis carbonis]|uniref:Aldehyde dehydrogenase family protein n=1 Tax=Amycolatopsis carbonis TaxID=715471 RepID=A0A9Y2IDJ5_9PSEU|nr:aldehyde dehydrogenase family protein [Amycolatopsis sp. 2-15]WIX77130.1 aldehyde dehydrogenase family protein [Amycolatopsis sp. 2-15]
MGGSAVFGPLLSVLEFDTEDEAVAIANGVEYGLTAAVWINGSSRHYVGTPFGGFKSSGIGPRNAWKNC